VAGEVSYLEIGAKDAGYPCLFEQTGCISHPNDGEGWFQIPSVKATGSDSSHSSSFSLTFRSMTAASRVKGLARQMRRDPTNLASDVSVPAEILKAAGLHQPLK